MGVARRKEEAGLMRAEEPNAGGPTEPTLTASCAIDPNNPSQYIISYTGSGFEPGQIIDIMIRGKDDPRGSGDPLGPGGSTGSFSRSMPYRGHRGRDVIVEVDRHIPPVAVEVDCPRLGLLPESGGRWAILLIAGGILIALWLLVWLARRLAAR